MAIRYAFKKLTRWADVRAKPHFSLEARPGTFEISIRVDAEGSANHILFNLVPKFRFSDFGILLRLSGREPSGIVRRNRRVCGGLARRRSSNGDWPRPAGLCLAGLHLEGLAGGETGGDDNIHLLAVGHLDGDCVAALGGGRHRHRERPTRHGRHGRHGLARHDDDVFRAGH